MLLMKYENIKLFNTDLLSVAMVILITLLVIWFAIKLIGG